MAKLPAFQFYPADWRKDPGIQALTYFDRGVWFEILCFMHESEQRGKLLLNGNPMSDEVLARLLGLDKQVLGKTLKTLIEFGVAERDEQGILVNRRMVRDEAIRQMRREVGKLGGNPNLVNQIPTTQVNQKSTPSSSSSITNTKKKKEEEKHMSANADVGPVQEVFEYWQTVMNHPSAKLTAERKSKTAARLKTFTVAEIKQAIDGCANSPHHMGDNDNGTIYDDLELICRTDTHVEKFISYRDRKGVRTNGTHQKQSERDKSAQRTINADRMANAIATGDTETLDAIFSGNGQGGGKGYLTS